MSKTKKPERFMELEGLRGVASIVVVLYHFLLAFYSLAFLGYGGSFSVGQNMRFEDNLYGNPIMVFLSGTFAVAIFFILSGFVLSIAFFKTKNVDVVKKMALKRYPRLMLPALASILIAYVVLSFGFSFTGQVAAITHSGWLAAGWNFEPSLTSAISGGIQGIFFQDKGNMYNGPLWTMYIEFLGSLLVFGFLALFAKAAYRKYVYGFLLFATFSTWFMAFVVGMIIADLYASGYLKQQKRKWRFVIPALVLGLFLGGFPLQNPANTLYNSMTIPGLTINWNVVYLTFGATIVVILLLTSSQLAQIFKHKFISILGKYTFSMYLMHTTVLYSFTTLTFLLLRQNVGLGFNTSAILAIIASIPVLAIITILFEKYIDKTSINFSSYISNILMGITPAPHVLTRVKKSIKLFKRRAIKLAARRSGGSAAQESIDY